MAEAHQSRRIVIDLNTDPRDANEFSNPLRIIQQDALDKMVALIRRSIDNIRQDERGSRELGIRRSAAPQVANRRHDVISVHGQRGSGKTTFILNVLAAIERNEDFCRRIGVETSDIVNLGLIDPTLIETKEHIIVTLLGRIKQEVDRSRDRCTDFRDYRSTPADYERWEESLRNLAEGLSLLDGIGADKIYGEDWQDAQYVLDRGLAHAASGTSFEPLFHDFIKQSLKFLNKSAFILAFDDIDTKFDRGWPVLETIRKYLTTPRLIVILSGDMDLYSMLVRGQQWNNFGEPLLKHEQWLSQNGGSLPGSAAPAVNARMGSIIKMVDKLEGQYLLKVLKPENRIDLAPLRRYADPKHDTSVFVQTSADTPEEPLGPMLEQLAAQALAMRSTTERALFRDVILRQSTRTVLQLLYGTRSFFLSRHDAHGVREREVSSDIQNAFRNTFATHLLARGLSPDDIRETDAFRLVLVLADWLTSGEGWALDYRLRPEHRDDNLNLAIMAVSAALVQEFKRSPGAMIDYLIKIARSHEWISRNTGNKKTIKEYVEFTGLNAGETPLQAVRKSAAWERSYGIRNIDRRLHSGLAAVPAERIDDSYNRALVDLYGLSYARTGAYERFPLFETDRIPKIVQTLKGPIKRYLSAIHALRSGEDDKASRYLHYFLNTIYTLSNNLTGGARLVASIPYIVVEDKAGYEYGYYSIDPVIAIIGEILSIEEPEPERAESTFRTRIWEILQRTFLKRTYPTPAAAEAGRLVEQESTGRSRTPKESDDEAIASEEDTALDDVGLILPEDRAGARQLFEVLLQWRLAVETRGTCPEAPTTLARAWKRFAYSASNVEDKLQHLETRYLGVLMHRYAVAFLNALLAESMVAAAGMRTGGDIAEVSELALNNPVTSSQVFHRNLLHAQSAADGAPLPDTALFWTVYSCPLWGFFLAPHAISDGGFDESQILKHQMEQWRVHAEAIGEAPGTIVMATYTPKRRGTTSGRRQPEQRSIEFDNLFDPLNSVYIQGGAPLERLRPLPLPSRGPVRRIQRPFPPAPTSPPPEAPPTSDTDE